MITHHITSRDNYHLYITLDDFKGDREGRPYKDTA
jgi:hypothetical protein